MLKYSMAMTINEINKLITNKHPDTEAQIEMVGPCSTNATGFYPKSRSEMDANRKRNRGRPKTTWRRTITTELSDMGLTMGEAQMIAQDRHRWRRDIVALCPTLG